MKIDVRTAQPYSVTIQRGALDQVGTILAQVKKPGCRAMLISETNVVPLYGDRAAASLEQAGYRVSRFVFPAGEESKQIATVCRMYEALAQNDFTRSDFIVTLGGGVCGDMGGFAAATYLRGIPFAQVPTTLLSQVDASVGGQDRRGPALRQKPGGGLPPAPGGHRGPGHPQDPVPPTISGTAWGSHQVRLYPEPGALRGPGGGPGPGRPGSGAGPVRGLQKGAGGGGRQGHRPPDDPELRPHLRPRPGEAPPLPGAVHGEAVGIGMVMACTAGERLGVTNPVPPSG